MAAVHIGQTAPGGEAARMPGHGECPVQDRVLRSASEGAGPDLEQGRLSGTVLTDDADELTRGDRQLGPARGGLLAVGLVDAEGLEDGCGCGCGCGYGC